MSQNIQKLLALIAEFPVRKRIDYDNEADRVFCNEVLIACKAAGPELKQLPENNRLIAAAPEFLRLGKLFVEWCATPDRAVTPEIIEGFHDVVAHAEGFGLGFGFGDMDVIGAGQGPTPQNRTLAELKAAISPETLPNPDAGWFLTYTGIQFYPLNPKPEMVCIEDIAHHLSRLCRFGGATKQHYSVAQHSLLVSSMLQGELAFLGLMHDATEAYCNDLVRPLKYAIPFYREIEHLIWGAIAAKFGLPATNPSDIPELKQADNAALMTERRDLLVKTSHNWSIKEKPLSFTVEPMSPDEAELQFLAAFRSFTSQVHALEVVNAPSNDEQKAPAEEHSTHNPVASPHTGDTAEATDQKSDTSGTPSLADERIAAARRAGAGRKPPTGKAAKPSGARKPAVTPPPAPKATPAAAQA
jgi:5'-deoxynucleotidase YfbR-like HD superfamily hydrolase